eukprot:scaffold15975_cov30-Attheya_sp.AAC.4
MSFKSNVNECGVGLGLEVIMDSHILEVCFDAGRDEGGVEAASFTAVDRFLLLYGFTGMMVGIMLGGRAITVCEDGKLSPPVVQAVDASLQQRITVCEDDMLSPPAVQAVDASLKQRITMCEDDMLSPPAVQAVDVSIKQQITVCEDDMIPPLEVQAVDASQSSNES